MRLTKTQEAILNKLPKDTWFRMMDVFHIGERNLDSQLRKLQSKGFLESRCTINDYWDPQFRRLP